MPSQLIAAHTVLSLPSMDKYLGWQKLFMKTKPCIVVDVQNRLATEGISIHWHGIHQRNTPWMDGVGLVSHCPIGPGASFRYIFKAFPTRAHFGTAPIAVCKEQTGCTVVSLSWRGTRWITIQSILRIIQRIIHCCCLIGRLKNPWHCSPKFMVDYGCSWKRNLVKYQILHTQCTVLPLHLTIVILGLFHTDQGSSTPKEDTLMYLLKIHSWVCLKLNKVKCTDFNWLVPRDFMRIGFQ